MYTEVFADVMSRAGPPESKQGKFSDNKSGSSDFSKMMHKVQNRKDIKELQSKKENNSADRSYSKEKSTIENKTRNNKKGKRADELSDKNDKPEVVETVSELALMLKENDISSLDKSSSAKFNSEKLLEILAGGSKDNKLQNIFSASENNSAEILAELKAELENLISLLSENSNELNKISEKNSIKTENIFGTQNGSGNKNYEELMNIQSKGLEILQKISEVQDMKNNSVSEMRSKEDILKVILNEKITSSSNGEKNVLRQSTGIAKDADNVLLANDLKNKKFFKSLNNGTAESGDARSAENPKILQNVLAGAEGNLEKNSQNKNQLFNVINLNKGLDLSSDTFSESAGELNSESSELNSEGHFNVFDLNLNKQNNFISKSDSAVNLNSQINLEDQILDTFKAEYSADKKELSVQLEPESLGKIDINLAYEDDKLIGKMMVESELVRSNLEKSLSGLKNELVKEGINIEQFKIETAKNNPQQVEEDRFFFEQNMGNSSDGESRHNQQFERDNFIGNSYYSSNNQSEGNFVKDKIPTAAANAYQRHSGLNLLV